MTLSQLQTRNAIKREKAATQELQPLCDQFADHANADAYELVSSYLADDVFCQRYRCPVCLNTFTVETVA